MVGNMARGHARDSAGSRTARWAGLHAWISASEAGKLKAEVDDMVEKLRRLGPRPPAVEEPRRKAVAVG